MKLAVVISRTLIVTLFACLPTLAAAAPNEPIEGFTEPYRDIDVAAAEMGVLAQIHVVEGDRVKAGQLLAQLDESVLLASLGIVKAEMEAEGRLESVQAELELQSDLVEKLEGLRDRKHASLQEVARAISQKKVLTARVKSVVEERTVKSYELRRIERQLDQRRVTAPIDGIITRVLKEPGEFVSPSDPIAAKIVQLDPLSIIFSVPLAQTRDLKKGGQVNLLVDTTGKHTGEIEFISPTADAQSGTTRVRVKLANPNEKIACGVPAQLLLPKTDK